MNLIETGIVSSSGAVSLGTVSAASDGNTKKELQYLILSADGTCSIQLFNGSTALTNVFFLSAGLTQTINLRNLGLEAENLKYTSTGSANFSILAGFTTKGK